MPSNCLDPARMLVLCLTLLAAGCARSPELRTDDGRDEYLRGVRTQWSVPLQSLGDTGELGESSSMRHALVAGDESFYVATSAFTVGRTIALDLVVINHLDHEVQIHTSDIHLLDAHGRRLTPRSRAPRAAARGFEGKRFASGTPSTLFQDFGVSGSDRDLPMATIEAGGPGSAKNLERSPVTSAPRSRTPGLSNLETAGRSPDRVIRSVRVGPDEGRAFWAYFENEDPRFPLTAWITLPDGDQLRYQFDH